MKRKKVSLAEYFSNFGGGINMNYKEAWELLRDNLKGVEDRLSRSEKE